MKLVLAFLLAALAIASEQTFFSCSLSGDPHFKSFDRINFDFQGVGWFDLVRSHAGTGDLVISAEFYKCGGASSTVSCMRNLVVSTTRTRGSAAVTVALLDGHYYYDINSAGRIEMTPLSNYNNPNQFGSTGVYAHYDGSMKVYTSEFSVIFRSGVVVVALENYAGSAEQSWGVICGICGTPDGITTNEYLTGDSTAWCLTTANPPDSTVRWNSIRTQINTWGHSLESPVGPGSKIYLMKEANSDAAEILSDTTVMADLVACATSLWTLGTCTNLKCTTAKDACLEEGEVGTVAYEQCMFDYYIICRHNPPNSDQWRNDRLYAAQVYNSFLPAEGAALIGLFIGLGVGLVFIIAGVAFFAKYPEKLPFRNKKAKIQKELAQTDVLK
jgi:hypothetical protein